MKRIDGGVCAPQGFSVACTAGHIKYENRDDCAMIVSEAPCISAGTFTSNVVKAAPVLFDRDIVHSDAPVRAVVVNTGIANAATGEAGLSICRAERDEAKKALSLAADEEVLVGSTGVIGAQVPQDRILSAIDAMAGKLFRSAEAASAASKAILTTDTHGKEIAVSFEVGGKKAVIGAMAKGSGMIHPNMCTMLSFVMTDCAISKDLLQEALSATVTDSYNMISVDGDMSTNDTCILLANGLAGNTEITEKGADYDTFVQALSVVNLFLAKSMAEDGEGATKLMEVRVTGAASDADARILAKSVAESMLTKAAVYGNDANWGRIMCALGYAGVDFDPSKTAIFVGNGETLVAEADRMIAGENLPDALTLQIVSGGTATDYGEEAATQILSGKHVIITCDMKAGSGAATAFGCDLTHEYIEINADYRS